MGSFSTETEMKTELNDSGYIQGDITPQKSSCSITNLLDLSDDVLLYILRYCSPMDLKALGYACSRLGVLVRDRTLWSRVDARGHPCGPLRLRWLLSYALNASTTELLLSGFARETVGCPGYCDVTMASEGARCFQPEGAQIWPRRLCKSMYSKSEPPSRTSDGETGSNSDESPQGSATPLFTINFIQMGHLNQTSNLTSLALEYCNIDCDLLTLNHFPTALKRLSLRGTKCFNQRVDRTFLFRVSDYLPELEYLDVSECQWMEPVSLMTLSKMSHLESLLMCDCHRLSEFVAYASLSTRYGFRKLKLLDLRGSPVGNSEVTALGWLPALQSLRLSPLAPPAPHCPHLAPHVPDYFKTDMKNFESDTVPSNNFIIRNEDALENKLNTNEEQSKTERESCKRKNERGDASQDSPKRQRRDRPDGESSKYTNSSDSENSDNDDNSKNKTVLIRRCMPNGITGGVRTVKTPEYTIVNGAQPSTSNCQNAPSNSSEPQMESYVRFRHNEMPTLINCQVFNNDNRNVSNDNDNRNNVNINANDDANNDNSDDNRMNDLRACRVEQFNPYDPLHRLPRAHIVYVNVREQRHNICRLSIPNEAPNIHEPRHCPLLPYIRESDPATLITDIAIQHFGRADGEDVNYFRIGPPGPEPLGRPNVSNLRELSVNGYRNITDRSLVHLATAAPYLRRIDFRETRVTQRGVDTFKNLRPDVEVVFSEFVEKEKRDESQ
ncbi:uncharacterized protein ACR2FA_011068 [Aphomia sociella]